MVYPRRLRTFKRRRQNTISAYGLLIITTMTWVHLAAAAAAECSAYKTCTKCTVQKQCGWQLDRQTCAEMTDPHDPASVRHLWANVVDDCPMYMIDYNAVRENNDSDSDQLYYAIDVTNDSQGFVEFVNRTAAVTCTVGDIRLPGRVADGRRIACDPVPVRWPSVTHCHVTFGDTVLRLEQKSDYYYVYFGSLLAHQTKECVSCQWDGPDDLAYYWKLCTFPDGNELEYLDVRNAADLAPRLNGARPVTVIGGSDRCPDVGVQHVEPSSGPWAGGMSLRITVNVHRTMMAGKALLVSVTVAGYDCANPETVDNRTIACTVAKNHRAGNEETAGSVRVTYKTSRQTYVLESDPTAFRFMYPRVTGVTPACGPLEGGALLDVRGRLLDTGTTVRVFAADDECEVIARRSDQILCRTGAASEPHSGPVSVKFDKMLSVRNSANRTFSYADGLWLHDGQRFDGITSGGTALLVRGGPFSCARNVTMRVWFRNDVAHTTGCRVLDDNRMACDTPDMRTEAPAPGNPPSRLRFGFRASFAGHTVELSPPTDRLYLSVYADPAFRNFDVAADGAVTVHANGRRGYRAEDVSVRLPDGGVCVVTAVTDGRIACRPASDHDPTALRRVTVSVGRQFARDVYRYDHYHGVTWSIVIIGVAVALSMTMFAVVLLFRAYITRCVTGHQYSMQYHDRLS